MRKDRKRFRECERKIRYATTQEANLALWALIGRVGTFPGRLHVYGCPHCRGVHVGRRKLRYVRWI